jgi:sugar-specific transcriptional regulator TrmB
MDLLQALKNIGFTQQEAIIYITLCKQGELTGYEAAKLSAISRSNAYAALSSLVEKGRAYIVQGASVKYSPVPKEELLLNTRRAFEENLGYIDQYFPEPVHSSEPYITVLGYNNIIDKIKNLLLLCTQRIYISTAPEELKLFQDELENAVKRGLKVVIITSKDPMIENAITYIQPKDQGPIKVIVDTKEVLTGRLEASENAQCLYSKNKTLVELIRETFMNEIELIKNLVHLPKGD